MINTVLAPVRAPNRQLRLIIDIERWFGIAQHANGGATTVTSIGIKASKTADHEVTELRTVSEGQSVERSSLFG